MKKFTESHEWIDVDDKIGMVGITDHAQQELGDIVYVELPEVGQELTNGDEVAVLESTKAAADIYSPVSGKIIAVNEALTDDSGLINSSPENMGWLFKIELSVPSELDELLEAEAYTQLV